MKTSIDKSFEVNQPSSLVWEHLIDPEKVIACVPGMSLEEKINDTTYKGKIGMKMGPFGVNYDSDITYEKVDKSEGVIELFGSGKDQRGAGNAEMRMRLQVEELENEGAVVSATMDISVTGKIAQFGSRLIHSVANQVFKQFVSNFNKKLEEASK